MSSVHLNKCMFRATNAIRSNIIRDWRVVDESALVGFSFLFSHTLTANREIEYFISLLLRRCQNHVVAVGFEKLPGHLPA